MISTQYLFDWSLGGAMVRMAGSNIGRKVLKAGAVAGDIAGRSVGSNTNLSRYADALIAPHKKVDLSKPGLKTGENFKSAHPTLANVAGTAAAWGSRFAGNNSVGNVIRNFGQGVSGRRKLRTDMNTTAGKVAGHAGHITRELAPEFSGTMIESPEVIKTVDKPNYTVDDYVNLPKSKIQKGDDGKPMYRRKRLPDGSLITIAITKKEGKRGGHTQVISRWRPKNKEV